MATLVSELVRLVAKRHIHRYCNHIVDDTYNCRCAGGLKRKFDQRLGSHAINISYGSRTCQSQNDTGSLFQDYSEKAPHFSCLLRRVWGYGGPIFILNPRVLFYVYDKQDLHRTIIIYTKDYSFCFEQASFRIEFYLFVSQCRMISRDGRFTCKFRNARSTFRKLIRTWIFCLLLHYEKETSRVQSLYSNFIKKCTVFIRCNVRF